MLMNETRTHTHTHGWACQCPCAGCAQRCIYIYIYIYIYILFYIAQNSIFTCLSFYISQKVSFDVIKCTDSYADGSFILHTGIFAYIYRYRVVPYTVALLYGALLSKEIYNIERERERERERETGPYALHATLYLHAGVSYRNMYLDHDLFFCTPVYLHIDLMFLCYLEYTKVTYLIPHSKYPISYTSYT